MKLCVFPNDPIVSYYNKGEIKERYYNPNNLFDEIHIISAIDQDIEESKVNTIAGKATMKIHSVGKISISNRQNKKSQILEIVGSIKPDVIRAYNPLLEGWVAAYCSEKLGIPFYVSLHLQYDGLRNQARRKNFKKYLALKYTEKFVEPYVLSRASKITAVYKIIDPYVFRICGKHPEILYNRVDLDRFQNSKRITNYDKPLILTVGRLVPQKNHHLIIQAVKDLDVYLQIIGDGDMYEFLSDLVEKLDMKEKVTFYKSIPNNKIQDYYKSADVFSLAYDPSIEGVPIPVLEAMASGLPIVISRPLEKLSDGLEGSVAFADLNSKSFSDEINKILNDKDYSQILAINAMKKSKNFGSNVIENRESEIYQSLLQRSTRI